MEHHLEFAILEKMAGPQAGPCDLSENYTLTAQSGPQTSSSTWGLLEIRPQGPVLEMSLVSAGLLEVRPIFVSGGHVDCAWRYQGVTLG